MRDRLTRIVLFALFVVVIGFVFNFFLDNFSGDGKSTPEEALPTDEEYIWIEAEKSDKEHRYFFLSNGNYFGTGTVIKKADGWKTGSSAYTPLPEPLAVNDITAASSDEEILFGLIKPEGNIEVTVNKEKAKFIQLDQLSQSDIKQYDIKDYVIWYINLSDLKDTNNYEIQVLSEEGEVINSLSI